MIKKKTEGKLKDLVNKGINTYNYYTGNSSSKYNYSDSPTEDELVNNKLGTLIRNIDRDKFPAKVDRDSGMIQYKFSSTAVPKNVADKVRPGGELYPYVTDYKDKVVTMELPLEGTKKYNKDEKKLQRIKDKQSKESMMTPVQVPEKDKSLQCDKYGHLILKDNKEVKNESLTEDYDNDEFYNGDPEYDMRYYEYVKSKSVLDSDGFYTDYTMYYDIVHDIFVFIFGDNDIYNPTNTEPDWEEENEDVANEWFDSYTGFEDEYRLSWDEDEFSEDKFPDDYKIDVGSEWGEDEELSDEEIQTDLDAASKEWGTDKEFEEEFEGLQLNETPGLTLSTPKVTYKDQDDYEGRLEVEINGKKYMYRCNMGTDATAREMADKVAKMQKYSDGKALAYLKKNMHLVTESVKAESVFKKVNPLILRDEVEDEFYKVAMSSDMDTYLWGFETQEDVDDFLMPRIEVEENDGEIIVTVAAEYSGYDAQYDMDSKLNKVIQKYDSGSYFEQVEPGISEAHVFTDDRKGRDVDTEVPLRGQDYAFEGLKLKERLFPATPYMLRNDGKVLVCGDAHPYVKYGHMDDDEALKFIIDNVRNLEWFYKNTNNESTRESIRELAASIDQIDNNLFNVSESTYVAKSPEEVQEFIDNLNDETNQEFLRLRMSAPLYGGSSDSLYARISSLHFDWYPLLWEVVNSSKNITDVTVIKDANTFGGRFQPYVIDGKSINEIPREDFLCLSNSACLEMYQSKLDIVNAANSKLLEGKTLREAYKGYRPKYVESFVQKDLKGGALEFDMSHLLASTKKVSEGLELKTEAHYGGAYDIADDQYFTREDLDMFAEELLDNLKIFTDDNINYDIGDIDIQNGNELFVEVDAEGNSFFGKVVIDMRKIKTPASLTVKYVPEILIQIMKQIDQYNKEGFAEIPLTSTAKKMIGESLRVESLGFTSDGWSDEVRDVVSDVLDDCYETKYEIDNTFRGYHTRAQVVAELADYFYGLADRMTSAAEDLQNQEEELNESKLDEKKVSFKDAYICKGCGKPLGQCTCDIKEEDLKEDATQVSNIGQHKLSSIDLIEDEKEEES